MINNHDAKQRDSKGGLVYILAAGEGKRMGGPKLFAGHQGVGFLERILSRCEEGQYSVCLVIQERHADKLFKVLSTDWQPRFFNRPKAGLMWHEAIYDATPEASGDHLVTVDAGQPMWHSLRSAAEHIQPRTGCWLWPVDAPFISKAAWKAARRVVFVCPQRVWKLRGADQNGHPVWLPAWIVPTLLHQQWEGGLKHLLRTLAAADTAILDMPAEDLKDKNFVTDLGCDVDFF